MENFNKHHVITSFLMASYMKSIGGTHHIRDVRADMMGLTMPQARQLKEWVDNL